MLLSEFINYQNLHVFNISVYIIFSQFKSSCEYGYLKIDLVVVCVNNAKVLKEKHTKNPIFSGVEQQKNC